MKLCDKEFFHTMKLYDKHFFINENLKKFASKFRVSTETLNKDFLS